ncbi:hypothetical protein [Bradyrhizobium sp. WSM1743]|uniref:hypothetical protein n=1 Tax=Bradyrhizobium sp. WSM1743 TaxID=318996 RepID=UPI000411CB6F|nr:hypothetical protein [Bradyrhizobium sp. WSM1743]
MISIEWNLHQSRNAFSAALAAKAKRLPGGIEKVDIELGHAGQQRHSSAVNSSSSAK